MQNRGKRIADLFANGWKPPSDQKALEWCESNIVIPADTGTPWPGQYKTTHTPWVRGWYEVIEDPRTRLFAVQKGSQVAFTQTVMCAELHRQCENPGAACYVMDSLDNARDTSKLRLQPIINASSAISRHLRPPDSGERAEDSLSNVLFRFDRSYLRFIGANSVGKASSFTYRDLILEEPEKYRDTLGEEGNVIENLMERVKRIWNSLILIGCTPTTKTGFIHKYLKLGDWMRFFVPCPKCGKMQVLAFSEAHLGFTGDESAPVIDAAHIVFDPELSPIEAAKGAFLECCNPECRYHITDKEKRKIVDFGVWQSTKKPDVTGYRSAELGGLYPKDESASIRATVEKFLSVKSNPSDLRVFVNSQLGQLWDYRPQKEMDKRSIWAIRDLHKYRRGVVPINGKFWLWLYIDVQEYFLPWAVYAQGPKDLALIDWGRVSGTADIETMLDRVWPVMGGRDASIDAIMIDSGFKTVQVYNWIRKNMRRVKIIPVKGQGEHVTQGELVKVSRMQSFPWINLHTLHRSKWHDMAGDLLAKLEPEEGQTILDAWESRSARLYLPQELDRDFVSELTAEVLMEEYDKKTGQTKRFYKRIRKNNHQFDLFRYALLTRHLMREDFNILKPDEKEVDPAQEKTEEIRQPKKVFDRYEEFDEDDNATYSEL